MDGGNDALVGGADASAGSGSVAFSHKGRDYILFRRPGQEKFYCRVQVRGKRILKCVGSTQKVVAVRNAKIWLDKVLAEDWAAAEKLKARSSVASLGVVMDAYQKGAERVLRLDPRTVKMNLLALEQIVAEGRGMDYGQLRGAKRRQSPAVRALRLDVLTADLLRAYVRRARLAGRTDAGIRSRIACARSVLCRAAVDNLYADLKLPDFSEFRAVDLALEGAHDLGFRPFSLQQVQGLEAAAEQARVENVGLWLAYIAMARFGMRNKEVWNARWDWFVEQVDGSVLLEIRSGAAGSEFRTKTRESRMIGVPACLWELLRAVRDAGDRVYFLPGETPTERRRIVERELNEMVRPILSGYKKGAYELRRWAGSRVWTDQTPAAAQDFLGHSSLTTTERYYSRFLGRSHAVAAPVVVAV